MTEATPTKPRAGLLAVVFNLLIMFASLAICTVLSELAVRWLFGDTMYLFPRFQTAAKYGPVSIPRLRPETTFRHTSPDGSWLFVTNNRGFRDRDDYRYENTDSIYRVLCLGDSQVMGYECEQDSTLPEQLERTLRHEGVAAEVLNCGVAGFGTAQELAFLEYEGLRYKPELVVVGYYANDWEDAVRSGLYRLAGDSLVLQNTVYLPGISLQDKLLSFGPTRWLVQHSYLSSLMLNVIAAETDREAMQARAVVNVDAGDLHRRLLLPMFHRMQTLCDSAGARLIVVDLPRPAAQGLRSSLDSVVVERLIQNGMELVRPLRVIDSLLDPAEVHRPHGLRHLTPAAHGVIARSLADQILLR